jgi:hypothetical protein
MPTFSEAESLPRAVLALVIAAAQGESLGTDSTLVEVKLTDGVEDAADEVKTAIYSVKTRMSYLHDRL